MTTQDRSPCPDRCAARITLRHFAAPLWTWVAVLLMGLAGSFTHCVGMCGPFVIAQVTAGLDGTAAGSGYGTLQRLRGAALVPYHLGRMTTYTALGAFLLNRIACQSK